MKIDPRFRTPRPHKITAEELLDESIEFYVMRAGRIDILDDLGPGQNYETLAATSISFNLGDGIEVRGARLDEIIASKERLGRVKDQAHFRRCTPLATNWRKRTKRATRCSTL